MHEKVHEEQFESRKGVRIERGMLLHSFELGLSAKVDVVEFYKSEGDKFWQAFPVEYKHGKPKADDCDKVQLCAQALCLEEMLNVKIPCGAIFYGKTRHVAPHARAWIEMIGICVVSILYYNFIILTKGG